MAIRLSITYKIVVWILLVILISGYKKIRQLPSQPLLFPKRGKPNALSVKGIPVWGLWGEQWHSFFSRVFLIALINLSITIELRSQYIDYLNNDAFNVMMNPVNTGNHHYDWKIVNVYNSKRFFSPNKFNSIYIAGDYNLLFFPDNLSLGAGIYSSYFVNTPFRSNMFYISTAFHKVYNVHQFHLGFVTAFQNIKLDSYNLLFPDQYDRNIGGYNSSLSTNELIDDNYSEHFDLNIGIVYSVLYNNMQPEIGFALIRINRPELNYTNNSETLAIEKSFFVKACYHYSEKLKILPVVYFISDQKEFHKTFGLNMNYGISKNSIIIKSLKSGVFFRAINENYPGSIILNLGVGHNNLQIDLHYNFFMSISDYIPGKIKTLEITLTYLGFNRETKQFSVPCEIY